MSQGVSKCIEELAGLSLTHLRQRWRELTGGESPSYSRGFLIKRLAYRLQEMAYGGLSQVTRARMEALLAKAGCDELGRLPAKPRSGRGNSSRPIVGTRFVRDWNGEHHEVTVVRGGLEHRGRRYRSLSAIARAITGTRWNGPAFFGLRGKKGQQ